MRVVLDTNVVVSRFLSSKGAPAEIFALWYQEKFELVVSEAILTEYLHALEHDKIKAHLKTSHEDILEIVSDFRRYAVLVDPEQTPRVIQDDPDDDRFLACAVAGGAEYLVSGDEHLLGLRTYEEIQILSPRTFLLLLSQ